ncbi:vacuolar fusion CCZ1-like protein, partial [Trifolium pratense]
MTPRALSSGTSSWSYLRKGNIASNVVAETNVASQNSMSESFYGSSDISHGDDNNYHVVRPLQSDKWSKGKDGYLVTDLWGAEVGTWVFATPTVLLQQTGERMYLCAYQHRSLTLMLLIPISSIPNGEQ